MSPHDVPVRFWRLYWRNRRKRRALLTFVGLVGIAASAHFWAHEPYGTGLPPLIPYHAHTLGTSEELAVSPFEAQQVSSWYYRHWLGTDDYGRDVAAGLLEGLQHALIIGIGGMILALVIGLSLGLVTGYYGDTRWTTTRRQLLRTLFIALLGSTFSAMQNHPFWVLKSIVIFGLATFFIVGISKSIYFSNRFLKILPHRIRAWGQHRIAIPIDFWLMRLIEILTALPTLLVFLAVLSVMPRVSIWNLVCLLGSVAWLSITRLVRGEMWHLRESGFLEAAVVLGLPTWRILLFHALPNVLPTAMVAFTLGVGQLILAETALSFLGFGLPPEVVTLGTMLSLARYHFSAWWLAVFPGLLIFWLLQLLQRLHGIE